MTELVTHFAEIVNMDVEPGGLKVNSYDGKTKLKSEVDMALRLGWRVEGEGAERGTLVDGKAWHFYTESSTHD
jgi:hypothetical protein